MEKISKREFVLTNARIVGRSAVVRGSVCVRDGVIAAVDAGAGPAGALDLDGGYLLPGAIETHTDNLERHLIPRPGVVWPSPLAALLAHDAQIAAAGITTVYDSICVGANLRGSGRRELLARSVEAVHVGRTEGLLRSDHWVHLRCEVADEKLMDILAPYADDPLVRLLSVMDHTPGQRQWTDVSKWRLYHRDRHWTDAEAEHVAAGLREMEAKFAGPNRDMVVRLARGRAIPLASHDDTTPEHVELSRKCGVVISEFPTTLAAARLARKYGLTVTMGAPNVVRGGSHSGNVSALELAAEGGLDVLSSDYVPESLIHAAFLLHARLDLPLPACIAAISRNAAEALGLSDRGEIAPGLRADMVHVTLHDGVPIVRGVWRAGERIF